MGEQPSGGGTGDSNAAANVLAGLAGGWGLALAGTNGLVQAVALVALSLLSALAAWLFASGRLG